MTQSNSEDTTIANGDDTSALVTIGVPLGISADVATNEKVGLLRYGRELLQLDLDEYMVLIRAARTVSRDRLSNWSSDRGIADPERIIDKCIERQTLRDVNFRAGQSGQWSNLRLQTFGVGVGPDESDRWAIEVPGREAATFDRFTYMFWAASDGRSVRQVSDALSSDLGYSSEHGILIAPLCVFEHLSKGTAFLDLAP